MKLRRILLFSILAAGLFGIYKLYFFITTGSFEPLEKWFPVCVREHYWTLGKISEKRSLNWVKSNKLGDVCVYVVSAVLVTILKLTVQGLPMTAKIKNG